MLDSQSINCNMEDIRFGDDNQRTEKAKQSFLQLKQKICRTHDVIQQYSNKVKECERLKAEVESAKKEVEEWKGQHFKSLAKVLKLNMVHSELEKSKKKLTQDISEMEIQRAGDQKHLQQLMCKLEDIEDRHADKLMTIELQKSGLQSEITDLQEELKTLRKTYNIKNDNDTTDKIVEKRKRGRKTVKSPIKTSRSVGVLPALDNEININNEVNKNTSNPTESISNDQINTEVIENKTSQGSNLPISFSIELLSDNNNKAPNSNELSKYIPIKKPTTCDKNIMTDEFYDTKSYVYPLQCDKCEEQLNLRPIEKILKTMSVCPPLTSALPPSPIRSKSIDREFNTNDISVKDNISVQNDTNVSEVLEKVQQSLQTLEKEMKKKNKKYKNEQQHFVPHCSHSIQKNCCNHNNDSINMTNLSQVNMMTTMWTSMMKFADKKLFKRRVKRKKISNTKLKRQMTSNKKKKKINKINMKMNSNSWIVESDTSSSSVFLHRDTTTDLISEITPQSTSTMRKTSSKNLIENKLENNIGRESKDIETNSRISPDVSFNYQDNSNCNSNMENMNSFKLDFPTSPSNIHSKNTMITTPNIMTRRTTKRLSIDSSNSLSHNDENLSSEVEMNLSNTTKSVPRSRTRLLRKLKQLKNHDKPSVKLMNVTKPVDYIEPIDKNTNSTDECPSEIKKRIAHVNKRISTESDAIIVKSDESVKKKIVIVEPHEIINSTPRKITRSMTKSEELIVSTTPKSAMKKLIQSSKNLQRFNRKVKAQNVPSSVINNSSESNDCNTNDKSNEISDETNYSIIDDQVNQVENNTDDKDQTFECDKKKDSLTASTIESNTKSEKSERINLDDSVLNLNATLEKKSSSIKNEEEHNVIDEIVEKESDELSRNLIEQKIIERTPEKMQIDDSNEIIKNISEHIDNHVNDLERETPIQLIIPSVNSSTNSVDNIQSPQWETDRTKNTQIHSAESTSDEDQQIRKRKRLSSVTKSDSESPQKFLFEKKKRISPTSSLLIEKSEMDLAKVKKKTVPEMIQNEIGKFFMSKRIITRSMKKNEGESLMTVPAESSPISKNNSPNSFGSPNTIKKPKIQVNEANNASINCSKSFVKNLFAVCNNEEKKLNSNINVDLKQNEDLDINNVETVYSIEKYYNSHENNTNNKIEETIIDISTSYLNNDSCDKESLAIPIEIEIKSIDNIQEENLVNDIITKEENKEDESKNSLESILEVSNVGDRLQENIKINPENNMEKETKEIDFDQKICELSSTREYDSPLSPNPISYPMDNDNSITNSQLSPANNSIEKSGNLQQIKQEFPENSRIPKHLLKHYKGSVRELRNRSVPVIPTKNVSEEKNDLISESIKQEEMIQSNNIKSLLVKHLATAALNDKGVKLQKYRALSAKKLTENIVNTVKQEVMRVIDSSEWDKSIHQSVVDNLSQINSDRSIGKAIINLISELSLLEKPLDKTYTPPAPMMTNGQQKIIAILVDLDKVKPDLIEIIFNGINYNLFHVGVSSEIEEIQSLTRIFVVLSKIKKDRERVRMMICDAMYSLQSKNIIVVHTALTCWPEVLPMYDDNTRQYLPMCIVHIIKQHNTKQSDLESKFTQTRNLIKHYYKYPDSVPMSTKILDELLNELTQPNYDKSVITAIVLLAKKEGTEWTYKNIIKERLLKIIIENKNSSAYDALTLLGYLMKCFPIQDPDGAVKSIVEQLCALLDAGTMSADIQEGVVMALLLLSIRHNRIIQIFKSILSWIPPRPLSPALKKQLEILFDSRPPLLLKQIGNK